MTTRIVRRYLCAAALPLALASCASMHSPTAEQAAPASMASVYHDVIELSGRLSVRYQANGREESLHGSFTWSQTPEQTVVTLLSPLGQTMAVIQVSPEGARLIQGNQPMRTAANVDALTATTLGWPLPVAGLRDWLQGIALDANGNRFVATPTAAEVTTRDGWHIRYANWVDDSSSAPSRPKRIDLSRTTEQAGDVSIRIVIDTWQTP